MALINLDQKRAEFAWNCANNNRNAEYKNSVKKLLPMIQANGIIAALTYFNAGGVETKKIFQQIKQWLCEQRYISSQTEMIQQLLTLNSMQIMDITREVVSLNGWLKRMVDCQ